MADKADIQDKLRKFFTIHGEVTIHDSGVVDVQGDVRFHGPMNKLPVTFGEVTGMFIVRGMLLTTLEGAPHTVGKSFDCGENKLTSLLHAPTSVGINFNCASNQLSSLEHAPTHVMGTFNCAGNQLESLHHAPESVDKDFSCYRNPLRTLEGAPHKVGHQWWISYDAHLPLLRTLNAEEIILVNQSDAQIKVEQILNKYMGQGKPGAIKAAAELIKAGFRENARW